MAEIIKIEVKTSGLAQVNKDLTDLENRIDSLNAKPVSISVSASGLATVKTELSAIREEAGKPVTLPVRMEVDRTSLDALRQQIGSIKSTVTVQAGPSSGGAASYAGMSAQELKAAASLVRAENEVEVQREKTARAAITERTEMERLRDTTVNTINAVADLTRAQNELGVEQEKTAQTTARSEVQMARLADTEVNRTNAQRDLVKANNQVAVAQERTAQTAAQSMVEMARLADTEVNRLNATTNLIHAENELGVAQEQTAQATERTRQVQERTIQAQERTTQAQERTAQTAAQSMVEMARLADTEVNRLNATTNLIHAENELGVAQEQTAQATERTRQVQERTIQAQERTIQARERTRQAELRLQQEQERTYRQNHRNRSTILGVVTGYQLLYRALTAVRSAFSDALNTMKAVDSELVTVRKVTGMAGSELEALEKQAYETASAYGVAANEYLQSVSAFARAGYKDQSAALAELSTKTQIVGDTTQDVANQFLLSVDAAYKYGGSIEKLSAVLDGANELDNKYATSIEKIAEGMGIVAPVAAQMHVTIDELAAALGTITAVTQRSGSEAARALRALFLNIVGDTKTEIDEGVTWTTGEIAGLRDVIKTYAPEAYKAAQATGSIIDPMEAMGGLAKSMKEGLLSEQELMEMVSDIGGKLRTSQLLAIIQNWDMFQSMLGDFGNAVGSADREVENALTAWERKTAVLSNTWAEFVSHLVDTDLIKGGLDLLTGIIKVLDNEVVQAIVTFTAFAAALSGVQRVATMLAQTNLVTGIGTFFRYLISGASGAGIAITALGETITAFVAANPFLVAIAAAAAAGYAAYKIYDRLNVTAEEHAKAVSEAAQTYQQETDALEELNQKLAENERLLEAAAAFGGDDRYYKQLKAENEQLSLQVKNREENARLAKEQLDIEAKAALSDQNDYTWKTGNKVQKSAGYGGAAGAITVDEYDTGGPLEYAQALLDMADAGEDVRGELAKVFQTILDLDGKLDDSNESSKAYKETIKALTDAYSDYLDQVEKSERQAATVAKISEAFEKIAKSAAGTEVISTETKKLHEATDALKEAYIELSDSGEISAETLEKLTERYPELAQETAITTDILVAYIEEALLAASATSGLSDAFGEAKAPLTAAGAAYAALTNALQTNRNEYDALKSAIEPVIAAIDELKSSGVLAEKTFDALLELFPSLAGKATQTAEGFKLDSEALEALAAAILEVTGNSSEFTERMDKAGAITDDVRESAERLIQKLDGIGSSISALKASVAPAITELNKAFQEFQESGELSAGTLLSIAEQFANVDGIEGYIQRLRDLGTSGEDVQSVLSDLTYALLTDDEAARAVAGSTEEVLELLLKESGIANADKVAVDMLAAAKVLLAQKSAIAAGNVGPLIAALQDEAAMSGTAKAALISLAAQMIATASTTMDFSQQMSALSSLATQAGVAAAMIAGINGRAAMSPEEQIHKLGRTYTQEEILSDYVNTVQAKAKESAQAAASVTPAVYSGGSSSGRSGGGGGSGSQKDPNEEALEAAKQIVSLRKSELTILEKQDAGYQEQSAAIEAVNAAIRAQIDLLKAQNADWETNAEVLTDINGLEAEILDNRKKIAELSETPASEAYEKAKEALSIEKQRLDTMEAHGASQEDLRAQTGKILELTHDVAEALRQTKEYREGEASALEEELSLQKDYMDTLEKSMEADKTRRWAPIEALKQELELAESTRAMRKAQGADETELIALLENEKQLEHQINELIRDTKEYREGDADTIKDLQTRSADWMSKEAEQEENRASIAAKALKVYQDAVSLAESELSLLESEEAASDALAGKHIEIADRLQEQLDYLTEQYDTQNLTIDQATELLALQQKINTERKTALDIAKQELETQKELLRDSLSDDVSLQKAILDLYKDRGDDTEAVLRQYQNWQNALNHQLTVLAADPETDPKDIVDIMDAMVNAAKEAGKYYNDLAQGNILSAADQDTLDRMERLVDLRKSELGLMEAAGKSEEEQIAKNREILDALIEKGEFLRDHNATQKTLNELALEALGIQKTIAELEADIAERAEQAKKAEYDYLKSVVSLRNSELSLMQARGDNEDALIWKERQILEAIEDQAKYMESIGAEQEEINSLAQQWWKVQNDILKLQQQQLDALKSQADDLIDQMEEDAVSPLRRQLEILKEQHDAVEETREEEEKLLAVEKARIALANAQRQRTVRTYNSSTGQWEWVANAKEVAKAEEELAEANADLSEYYAEREYKAAVFALELQIEYTEKAFEALRDALDYVAKKIKAGEMTYKEAYDYIKGKMKAVYDEYEDYATRIYERTYSYISDQHKKLYNDFKLNLSGAMDEAVSDFEDTAERANTDIQIVVDKVMGGFEDISAEIAKTQNTFTTARAQLSEALANGSGDLTGAFRDAVAGFGDLNAKLKRASDGLDEAGNGIDLAAITFANLNTDLTASENALKTTADILAGLPDIFQKLLDGLKLDTEQQSTDWIEEMYQNSLAWYTDPANRSYYSSENQRIGKEHGLTYDSANGVWYWPNGEYLYTEQQRQTLTSLAKTADAQAAQALLLEQQALLMQQQSGGLSSGGSGLLNSIGKAVGSVASGIGKVASGIGNAVSSAVSKVTGSSGSSSSKSSSSSSSSSSGGSSGSSVKSAVSAVGSAVKSAVSWLTSKFDSGGILQGMGGIKATVEDEMVLPPDLTKKVLAKQRTPEFESAVRQMGIIYGSRDNGKMSVSGGVTNNSYGPQESGDKFFINGLEVKDVTKGTTIGELARRARDLSLYSGR